LRPPFSSRIARYRAATRRSCRSAGLTLSKLRPSTDRSQDLLGGLLSLTGLAASTTGAVSGAAVSGGALPTGTSSGGRLCYTGGGVFFADGGTVNRLPAAGGLSSRSRRQRALSPFLAQTRAICSSTTGRAIGYVPLPAGNAAAPKPMIITVSIPALRDTLPPTKTHAYWVKPGRSDLRDYKTAQRLLKALAVPPCR
jgi:hypothetical protein